MFSSFYNTQSFHTLLTEEIFDNVSNIKSPTILHTAPSVTFKASIVPSPTTKIPKLSYLKINQFLIHSLPIILPFGRFHLIWSVMLFFILTYTVVETPYTVAFYDLLSIHDTVYIISLLIDGLLLLDIAINFRTAYIDKYDRLRIIHEPKLIAIHYFKMWFIIDLLAAFPFSLIALLISGSPKYLLLFRMLRLIKLIRIMRILKMFKLFQQRALQYEARTVLKLVKVLFFMLLTAHFCACFWFFIGRYTYSLDMHSWIDIIIQDTDTQLHNLPAFKLYSFSIYWSIVTLFTTGYGDITAHNEYEQWTAICCILIGSMFFAYVIGTISSLLNNDRVHCHESQKIEEALLFCSHYNLPNELTTAIQTHIRYYQKYNFVFDKKEIMDSLPSYLQKSVQTHLATNILKGLDIFQSLSPSIIGQIALKLKSKSINMGHLLFKAGDIGKELYIQRTGKSKLLYNGLPSYQRKLKRGDVCGENVIINRKRVHSVQCETWSEFYSLDIRDIIDILKNNLEPVTAQKEWEKIKQIVRYTKGTNHRTTIPTPRFQEFVPAEICDTDENVRSAESNNKKKSTSFKSVQNAFDMGNEKSVLRDESIIKNFNKQQSDLVIQLPQYCDDNKFYDIDDGDERSDDSGGFGERFGLYKIRKHKIQKVYNQYSNIPPTPNIKGLKGPNINIIDDILGRDELTPHSNADLEYDI